MVSLVSKGKLVLCRTHMHAVGLIEKYCMYGGCDDAVVLVVSIIAAALLSERHFKTD